MLGQDVIPRKENAGHKARQVQQGGIERLQPPYEFEICPERNAINPIRPKPEFSRDACGALVTS